MTERMSQAGSDGVCWSCSICTAAVGTEVLVTDFADEAEISEHTACDIYQWLREVSSTKLLQSPVVLGGPGVVVQIDESQFRHKPKV